MKLPTAGDVEAAARRLAGVAVRTPLLRARGLPGNGGAEVWLKCETLQVGGAFKFRGAYNRLAQLGEREARAGVVAWSSGNHAQGVAAAGKMLGIHCAIVMPADAPRIKVEHTRRLGAEIVFYDRARESREDIARRLVAQRGATLVPSYDDADVIAGQGTLALEMAAQARESDVALDCVIVPVGGGGLIAGCALALESASPGTCVFGAEPEGFDDTARSLAAGARMAGNAGGESLCDALLAPTPGELTFAINQRLLAGVRVATDAQVLAAMAWAWREMKLVVEPGGAVALAAVLAGWHHGARRVGVVLSGGNVDADVFSRALALR